jgi:hypothetical protein
MASLFDAYEPDDCRDADALAAAQARPLSEQSCPFPLDPSDVPQVWWDEGDYEEWDERKTHDWPRRIEYRGEMFQLDSIGYYENVYDLNDHRRFECADDEIVLIEESPDGELHQTRLLPSDWKPIREWL